MRCSIDEDEENIEKLIVSRQPNELIDGYMTLKNKYTTRIKVPIKYTGVPSRNTCLFTVK